MSNLIPDGWDSKKLIDCSANGISNGVFCDPKKVGSGYKLINVYEMYQGYGVDVNLTRRLQLDEKEFLKNKVNYGDVFFTRSSLKLDGIAYCNINLSHDSDITYDGHLMKIVPDENVVHSEYLARYCLSDFARTYFMSTAKHSTMTTIAQADIAPLRVLLPPLPEQQKIAAILTSVDDVIEKTQAQIDKLKDLKTGMMQELLTHGIGVDGKPNTEFKDSPVGRIPKGWDVLLFSKVTQKIQDGTHFSPQSKEGPCLYLTSKNIQKGKLLLKNISYISQEEHDAIYKRCNVQYGDVLLTKDGANTGNCAMNTLNEPFSLLSSVAFLRCNENICLNHYLYQFMSSSTFKRVVKDSMTGNAITRLTLTIIKNLKIAVPPINEQLKIVKYLSSIDNNLELKNLKLESLKSTKKALMQDLLTGKVRVKVDS